ncbi:MAG: carboxylating nicotinate-nucleotide diphosphorylase [bacterium]
MTNDKCQMNVEIIKLVKQALREDIGSGDITTEAIVPKEQKAKAVIIAKEKGIITGLAVAKEVFRQVDRRIKFTAVVKDGAKVKKGKIIAKLSGPARGILTGERTALNFLQQLSGVATLTSQFVSKVKGTRAKVLDTRKTTPGLRALEKYAVKAGGGVNHRLGLWDEILVKDNHIEAAEGIDKALKAIKGKKAFKVIEAGTLAQAKKAIMARVDRILLDNMNLKTLRQAVKLCRKAKIKTEASGGVNLKTVRAISKTGVDYISVGALTHSARALDISLIIL